MEQSFVADFVLGAVQHCSKDPLKLGHGYVLQISKVIQGVTFQIQNGKFSTGVWCWVGGLHCLRFSAEAANTSFVHSCPDAFKLMNEPI